LYRSTDSSRPESTSKHNSKAQPRHQPITQIVSVAMRPQAIIRPVKTVPNGLTVIPAALQVFRVALVNFDTPPVNFTGNLRRISFIF
jgi:hypothetical protein